MAPYIKHCTTYGYPGTYITVQYNSSALVGPSLAKALLLQPGQSATVFGIKHY